MLSTDTLDKAKFWSTMDPRPIIVYEPKYDAYFACWNGVTMTHRQALLIASSLVFGIYPNPKMKASAWDEFKKLYYSGAFGHMSWNIQEQSAGSHFKYLHKITFDHYEQKLKDLHTPIEVLQWFDKKELQYD